MQNKYNLSLLVEPHEVSIYAKAGVTDEGLI